MELGSEGCFSRVRVSNLSSTLFSNLFELMSVDLIGIIVLLFYLRVIGLDVECCIVLTSLPGSFSRVSTVDVGRFLFCFFDSYEFKYPIFSVPVSVILDPCGCITDLFT